MVVTSITHQIEPSCYSQAAKQQEWRSAMSTEFNALIQAGTWQLVPYAPSMNVLPNKWVFCIKRKPDGSVERYKARLVAKGFRQQEGIDYGETFSPDVYMQQPQGFIDPQFPTHVCKLRRSLYGLKQAPRAWFSCFSTYLEDLGFTASQADTSLFACHSGNIKLYLLIYVDDILVTGTHADHISTLITNLSKLFSMKDLGPLHSFLGIEVVRSSHGLALTQTKYTLDLLHRTNMTDAKPVSTPAATGKRLSLTDGTPLHDGSQYRSVVGALQYLTLTRPDISFVVNQVCQFLHSPTNMHWVSVKRILHYLKHTPTYGLFYTPSNFKLTGYSDSDYAGDPDTRISTGGTCIYLGTNLISWSSKKQSGVSRSSTETEYRQLAYTAAHISWLRALFRDLCIPLQSPTLWCDNISAISLASNPVFHTRTRHVEVDYHYIREKVVRKEIQVAYICSQDQIADIFTKGLSSSRFHYLLSKLLVRARPISLRGGGC
ncbi:putative RNA-directed DNA polymerase [Rosa chinensis]|uniref:Putative RNA-directed DNA polymerase n=1 Tax=Rosa chinensis TaxID=74649 RepID=A0A2P6PAB5_ROSCH|nr:putative RNA-directed DNA polymerase [Rosa chinensis]